MNENLYLHAFNLLPQIGPKRLLLLSQHFPNFKSAFNAEATELEVAGLPSDVIEIFIKHRAVLDISKEADYLKANNINLVSYKNTNYPKLLLEISALPPLLYVKGELNDSEELMLAVVGTRKITNYGRTVLPLILEPLVNLKLTIVSGLAYGIDAAAHSVAIERNGRTVAVLGCGLDEDSLYPKEHQYLADQIIARGGALLSEHPPGRPALKQNFVARNRIISGLSFGTLVVECSQKSGALITANHALEQNRQIYAVPGPIYSAESQGPNNLIKLGAKAVMSASEILEDLNITGLPQATLETFEGTKEEREILKQLTFEPVNIDEIIKRSNLGAAEASANLTLLEMKGVIKNLGGQQYILARRVQ